MSEIDLDAIEARVNAATEGPWRWTHGMDARCMVLGPDALQFKGEGYPDAEFIAHARTDIPALIARVRELRAVVKGMAQTIESERARADDELNRRIVAECDRDEAQIERSDAMREMQSIRRAAIEGDHG